MKKTISKLTLVLFAAFTPHLSMAADSSSYGASNVTTQAGSGGGAIIGAAGRLQAYAGRQCNDKTSPTDNFYKEGYVDPTGNYISRQCYNNGCYAYVNNGNITVYGKIATQSSTGGFKSTGSNSAMIITPAGIETTSSTSSGTGGIGGQAISSTGSGVCAWSQ